ncbi:SRPBCC domain-containing protein [Candidatus Leptofilum sp.]|uniref:SRPBCC domain-containing protein n=1 Tax=Candidatus Leptofilum sp. TaxID=3241576 RepID=UPI003B5BB2CE
MNESALLTARAYIQANYDEVWKQFTNASAYAAWFSAPCLEFGTKIGDRVAWGVDAPFYQGTIQSIQKGQGISHTIQFTGFGFDEAPTLVAIEIIEQGATVLVTIQHDCTDAPQTAKIIGSLGWLKSLSRLKTLLETGEPMIWPEP